MDTGPIKPQSGIVSENLRDFFGGLIHSAAENQSLRLSPALFAYVTDVLVEFNETAKLFAQAGVRIPVLADMLSDALDADLYRKITLLRKMGDTSLMVSGYFPEALARRTIDLSYYQKMGEIAYSQLGSLTSEASIFEDLSEHFVRLSHLIGEVSEATGPKSYDLLKLIEIYMKTGSDRALEKLKRQGVVPLRRGPNHR